MIKKFNPDKFGRYAKIFKWIITVFYAVSIIALVVIGVLAILCVTLPNKYFNIDGLGSGNFIFKLNNMISYDIRTTALPDGVNLRKIYISIVGGTFLYALVLMQTFKHLKEILKTVVSGMPFSKENPMHFMNIAAAIIGGSFLFPSVNELVCKRMIETFQLKGFSTNYSVDLVLFITGMLLVVLAGIFRYGCYLQNEYDETL